MLNHEFTLSWTGSRMKIIDIINKMANKDNFPTIIKYDKQIFFYKEEYSSHFVLEDDNTIFLDLLNCLNDDVEILDEEYLEQEKLNKITLLGEEIKHGSMWEWIKDDYEYCDDEDIWKKIASAIEVNAMKINKIIEKINEQKEK